RVKGWGDLRLVATYQGLLDERNLGLQLGLKLPTGHYGGAGADGSGIVGRHPAAFKAGPLSTNDVPDNLLDTSLQAGTGTTDVIVGAYYHQPVSTNVEAFVDGQYQAAIANRLHRA